MPTYGEKLKKLNKKEKKKDRFIRTRMWFSTLISALYNDRGVIPPNIGNNILVGNNMYITKNNLSMCIIIREFSDDTEVAFISNAMRAVKDSISDIIIDFKIKNVRAFIDTSASGMKSRISTWESTLDNPFMPDAMARRAARCLYTVKVIQTGEKIYRSRAYIIIRAKTGTKLNAGIKQMCDYLNSYGISYRVVKNNMKLHLDYISMICDNSPKQVKDFPAVVMSNQTIAEVLPMIQGFNDYTGTLMGIDMESLVPYYINFRLSSNAKNVYVAARSGFGKTFLVLNWIIDMYADSYNMCIMDIKGTEFTEFTKACGGKILSMRTESTYYINTFRWLVEEVKNNDYLIYASTRMNLSKEIMMIICDFNQQETSRAEALLEEFLRSAYLELGVLEDNPNTWKRTENLTPYTIYDMFSRYLSVDILSKYSDVAEKMRERLRIYMSSSGSRSYIFRDAFSYQEILESKVLTFDFGLLETSGQQDYVLFKLRVMFMELLNDEFVAYKKSKGEWTVKILEESQVVKNYIMDIYVKEMTLGRARNQINVMLGNSVSALADNPVARAAIENINIMVLGVLNKSSKDYIVKEFNLQESDADKLDLITDNPDFENTFLFINKMEKNSTTGMIKAFVPDHVRDGKLFKVVDTDEE